MEYVSTRRYVAEHFTDSMMGEMVRVSGAGDDNMVYAVLRPEEFEIQFAPDVAEVPAQYESIPEEGPAPTP